MIRNSSKCINLIQKSLNRNQISSINVTNTIIGNNNNKNNKNIYRTFSSSNGNEKFNSSNDMTNNKNNNRRYNNEMSYEEEEEDEYEQDPKSRDRFDDNYDDEDDEGGHRLQGETAQQQFNRETREDLHELEIDILDLEPPLYNQIKYELHGLYNEDPTFWDVKRLSQVFQIHPGRVVALIRYVDIEKMEIEKGFPVYKDIEMELERNWGVRLEDEYLGEDEHQIKMDNISKNHFSFGSGVGRNAKTLNDSYKEGKSGKINKRGKGNKPDPIHEVPTKIPDAFPEEPIYFRGPTFVLPRKKNLVFVDTSRDPITKKVNPDPMVLIQGIDGSLRTPSSQEKDTIINKVRPQKVKRDYETILESPIKYRMASQQFPKPPKEEPKLEDGVDGENLEKLDN